jgi:hypothetical protein
MFFMVRGIQTAFEGLKSAILAPLNAISTGISAVFGPMQEKISASLLDWNRWTAAAREAEVGQVRFSAVLAATGDVIGYTAKELANMRSYFAEKTDFSGGALRQAQQELIQLRDIRGENLFRALQVSLDLAARSGSDLASTTDTIGRALVSPEQGMMRLRRAGVLLSDAEKELITQAGAGGDAFRQQGVMLDILQKKIGDIASQMTGTAEGKLTRLGHVWAGLGKTIWGFLTPLQGAVAELASTLISTLTNAIAPTFSGFTATTKGWADAISGFLRENKETFMLWGELGKQIVGNVASYVTGKLSDLFGIHGSSQVQDYWEKATAGATQFLGLMSTLTEDIPLYWDTAKLKMQQMWGNFKTTAFKAWTDLESMLEPLFIRIGDALYKAMIDAPKRWHQAMQEAANLKINQATNNLLPGIAASGARTHQLFEQVVSDAYNDINTKFGLGGKAMPSGAAAVANQYQAPPLVRAPQIAAGMASMVGLAGGGPLAGIGQLAIGRDQIEDAIAAKVQEANMAIARGIGSAAGGPLAAIGQLAAQPLPGSEAAAVLDASKAMTVASVALDKLAGKVEGPLKIQPPQPAPPEKKADEFEDKIAANIAKGKANLKKALEATSPPAFTGRTGSPVEDRKAKEGQGQILGIEQYSRAIQEGILNEQSAQERTAKNTESTATGVGTLIDILRGGPKTETPARAAGLVGQLAGGPLAGLAGAAASKSDLQSLYAKQTAGLIGQLGAGPLAGLGGAFVPPPPTEQQAKLKADVKEFAGMLDARVAKANAAKFVGQPAPKPAMPVPAPTTAEMVPPLRPVPAAPTAQSPIVKQFQDLTASLEDSFGDWKKAKDQATPQESDIAKWRRAKTEATPQESDIAKWKKAKAESVPQEGDFAKWKKAKAAAEFVGPPTPEAPELVGPPAPAGSEFVGPPAPEGKQPETDFTDIGDQFRDFLASLMESTKADVAKTAEPTGPPAPELDFRDTEALDRMSQYGAAIESGIRDQQGYAAETARNTATIASLLARGPTGGSDQPRVTPSQSAAISTWG